MQDLKANEKLSPEESFWLWVIRNNKENPGKEFRREWKAFGFLIVYSQKHKNNLWGRFGGGWNWKLGFMIGGSTVIFDLLVASIRIARIK